MYVGKHEQRRKKRRSNRSLVLTISVIALVVCIVGASLAYLFAGTDGITNTFTPTKVTTDIDEKLDGNVKENVTIKNTGDIAAFVRAQVIITWKDASGNVYANMPVENTDYTIEWGPEWVKGSDGFYYYTSEVQPNASTPALIVKCEKIGTPPAGDTNTGASYDLSVEIISQSIQSRPDSAVKEAWGVDATSGTLTVNAN